MDLGAEPNVRNTYASPLGMAIMTNREDVVQLLLDYRASPTSYAYFTVVGRNANLPKLTEGLMNTFLARGQLRESQWIHLIR